MQREQIKSYFEKLKKGHDILVKVSEPKKKQIVEAYSVIFDKLEELGVDRTFSESLLIWGKEFVDSLRKKKLKNDQDGLFQPAAQAEAVSVFQAVADEEGFIDGKSKLVRDAEEAFGVEATVPSAQLQREIDLAKKHGVWWWKSLPAKDGKVKIQAVAEYKRGVDSQS